MIAYSFTIMSWNSREYTGENGSMEEKFLVRKRNRSDSFYLEEHYLNNLLDAVKMPSTKKPVESSDKDGQTDQMKGEPRDITCEELKKIMAGECKQPSFISSGENLTGDLKIWCFSDKESLDDYDFISDVTKTQPPDYTMKSSEWKKCKEDLNNR